MTAPIVNSTTATAAVAAAATSTNLNPNAKLAIDLAQKKLQIDRELNCINNAAKVQMDELKKKVKRIQFNL